MTSENPKLWIDCDGTAVSGIDPRNMPKRPLRAMPGFRDFLDGLKSAETEDGEHVEVAGLLTMRPRIFLALTALEVRIHGLGAAFAVRDRMLHLGSERARAAFLTAQSEKAPVGMLDDNPHRLGGEILKLLRLSPARDDVAERSILLGTVNHPRSRRFIAELLGKAKTLAGPDSIEEFEYDPDSDVATGHNIRIGRATLSVVQLGHYSEKAGRRFGERLLAR